MGATTTPTYNLLAHERARKEYRALPASIRARFGHVFDAMRSQRDPTSHPKVKPIVADELPDLHRVRVGDWRAIVHVDAPDLLVLSVERREKDYRGLETAALRLR